jgi:hypothetical protein
MSHGVDFEEKHESDIDTVAVGSLKVLDPNWPIREADVVIALANVLSVNNGRHRAQHVL